MPSQIDKKQEIENALMSFSCPSSASDLLRVLGYQSPKTLKLSDQTAQTFLAAFNQAGTLKKDKALVDDWASIDILFQITDEEVRDRLGQVQLFNNTQADKTNIRSFLFFSLCLKAQAYTRTQLATITREINKLFMMPVIIFFTYQQKLSIGIITRRINRRDVNKDVLEKVTLIKDINLASPHRAHVEILYDLSLPTLAGKYPLTNFADLQSAWQKTLDVEELNKKFYRELQSWYFWSLLHVTFPEANGSTSPDSPNASNIIRLITRLIFSWFLKEKGLIPEDLFNEHKLQHILNYQDPNNSTYYKAILQNLFFATLNQEMNSPGKEPKRKFRRLNGHAGGLNSNRLVTNLYRYQRYFKDPAAALELFEGIPFLNGGLFECLDHELEENNQKKVVRIDGFSDENGNVLRVPDELFFGEEQVVDLSSFFEEKNKRTPVKGIIRILESYKFTVEENTPINEEVALDPELLGKVFENLLAAYNPETSTTARKSTGSYYTPRAIVDYMVDEALIAFFTNYLKEHEGSHQSEAAAHPSAAPKTASASPLDSQGKSTLEACVRALLSYSDAEHGFTELETRLLVEAIDQVNVLDPACGSGAFPMGVLHKLVHVLGRLDPDNQLWQEVQLDKAVRETEEAYRIGNQEEREHRKKDIEEAFDNNTSDYGRKLYLIESCLYGVDIQPIAVQISKLRFFISLVVDQKTDRTKENLGIRPLPNLETKFVAANSLIGLQKPDQQSPTWMDFGLSAKEAELAEIRHKLFSARTVETKRKYRAQDKATRLEIRDLLLKKGWDNANASKLADWDPYDQNSSAPFFDPEWMMGNRTGFDIVIGNPPYIDYRQIDGHTKAGLNHFYCYRLTKTANLYIYFLELGLVLLKEKGVLVFINPYQYLTSDSGYGFRKLLFERYTCNKILDVSKLPIFSSSTYPCINIYTKEPSSNKQIEFVSCNTIEDIFNNGFFITQNRELSTKYRIILTNKHSLLARISENTTPLGSVCDIFCGSSNSETAKSIKSQSELKELSLAERTLYHPIVLTRNIQRYLLRDVSSFVPEEVYSRNVRKKFLNEKIFLGRMTQVIRCAYTKEPYYGGKVNVLINMKLDPYYLLGLLNSKLINYWYIANFGSKHLSGGYLSFDIPSVSEIPIMKTTSVWENGLISLVFQVISINSHEESPTHELVREKKNILGKIDKLVFRIYSIGAEDIQVIDNYSLPSN